MLIKADILDAIIQLLKSYNPSNREDILRVDLALLRGPPPLSTTVLAERRLVEAAVRLMTFLDKMDGQIAVLLMLYFIEGDAEFQTTIMEYFLRHGVKDTLGYFKTALLSLREPNRNDNRSLGEPGGKDNSHRSGRKEDGSHREPSRKDDRSLGKPSKKDQLDIPGRIKPSSSAETLERCHGWLES